MTVRDSWTLAVTSVAVVFAVLAAGAGAQGSRARACVGGLDTTHSGQLVSVFCGPASATMKYAGKSYTFTQGTCLYQSQLQFGQTFRLELGVNSGPKRGAAPSPPYFNIFKVTPGEGQPFENHLSIENGTKRWTAVGLYRGNDLTINLTSDGGSFKTTSAFLRVAGKIVNSRVTVTGSFKCH